MQRGQSFLFGRARPAGDIPAVLVSLARGARTWTAPERLEAELPG